MKLGGLDTGEILVPEAFDLGPQPWKLQREKLHHREKKSFSGLPKSKRFNADS